MCRFKISSTILRGFHRIRHFYTLIALIATIPSNTQGHVPLSNFERIPEAGQFPEIHGSLDSTIERMEFLNNEDILLGHSGDPWASYNESEDLKNPRIRLKSFQLSGRSLKNTTGGNARHRRLKRSVVHLYNMVVCATGCNPTSYKGYGCYCGFLGSGSAVDGIDQCCRMHDRCYDATECPSFLQYFVPYYWKCYRGYRPICAVEHGKWGGSGSCAQRLCECDRALSECLRRFPCPTSKAVCTTSPWRLIQNVFMIL